MSPTNQQGRPVLEVPMPLGPRLDERESPLPLVLNFCAGGCKRLGHWQFDHRGWCESCFPVEIARSVR